MSQFPLLFRFHTPVIGNGFIADVDMRGRALLTLGEGEPESKAWIDGVMPGGLAGGGETVTEAHAEFQKSLLGILSDIADESAGFDGFKDQVQSFFNEIDQSDYESWKAAVDGVRAGNCGAEFLRLRRLSAEDQRCVRVVRIAPDGLTTDLNRVPPAPAIAA